MSKCKNYSKNTLLMKLEHKIQWAQTGKSCDHRRSENIPCQLNILAYIRKIHFQPYISTLLLAHSRSATCSRLLAADQVWVKPATSRLRVRYSYRHNYYRRRIGNRTQAFKWYQFEWPWVTSNLDFKVTILFEHLYSPQVIAKTRSSAVAERLRDASCLSVVSFNIRTAQFFITSYCGFELLVHKILLWLGYPMMKKFRRYLYSFWRNSRTWQTHRQTDRQTDRWKNTAWQHTPRLCIASRGKNDVPVLYRENWPKSTAVITAVA